MFSLSCPAFPTIWLDSARPPASTPGHGHRGSEPSIVALNKITDASRPSAPKPRNRADDGQHHGDHRRRTASSPTSRRRKMRNHFIRKAHNRSGWRVRASSSGAVGDHEVRAPRREGQPRCARRRRSAPHQEAMARRRRRMPITEGRQLVVDIGGGRRLAVISPRASLGTSVGRRKRDRRRDQPERAKEQTAYRAPHRRGDQDEIGSEFARAQDDVRQRRHSAKAAVNVTINEEEIRRA